MLAVLLAVTKLAFRYALLLFASGTSYLSSRTPCRSNIIAKLQLYVYTFIIVDFVLYLLLGSSCLIILGHH